MRVLLLHFMGFRENFTGFIKRVLPPSDEGIVRSYDELGFLGDPRKIITGTLIDNGGCALVEVLDKALASRKFGRNMGFSANSVVRYGIELGFLEGKLTTEGPEICIADFSVKPQVTS